MLLTHLHADHVEGLPGVLRGRQVGEVATSGYDEPAGELHRVRGWARRAAVPLTTVATGSRMSVGSVTWQVLWPSRMIEEESVPNNASLVLLVRSQGLRSAHGGRRAARAACPAGACECPRSTC